MKEIQQIYMNIGQKIRYIRKTKQMTLEDLAFEIDMDWSFIARIETGKTVASLETLFKISKALNIKLEQLFEGVDMRQDEMIKKEFKNIINVIPNKEKDKIIQIIKLILQK